MLSQLIQWVKDLVGKPHGSEKASQPAQHSGQPRKSKGDRKPEAEHPDSVYPLW
jgi:hypothetical protein